MYFATATVVEWQAVFTREIYKAILQGEYPALSTEPWIEDIGMGVADKLLYTICSCNEGRDAGLIWRNSKNFMAIKLIGTIINNSKESRKVHLLYVFEEAFNEYLILVQ